MAEDTAKTPIVPEDFIRLVPIPISERILAGLQGMVNVLAVGFFSFISFPFIFFKHFNKSSYRVFEQQAYLNALVRNGQPLPGPAPQTLTIKHEDDDEDWMKDHKKEYGDE